MEIERKVLDTIRRHGMLKKEDGILVAVSGGPDSVFLLHILNSLKKHLGIYLCVAHLDHGIRGRESRADAEFVKKLAKSLKLKFIYKKLENMKKTKSKFSLEERLREARYDFFKDTARKLNIRAVATAHTLDDQAETVLMRVIKGASLKGIIGVHPVRHEKNIKFIRPLIEIEKKDIVKELKKKKIPFRIDRTNLENRFLRNKIRNRIIPYLEKINPRVKRSLFNLAESLREDFEFIEEEKKRRLSLIKTKKLSPYILLKDMLLQPKALQKELAREALKASGANIKKLTFRHWQDIDKFLRTAQRGKSIDLPGGVKMRKDAHRLVFVGARHAVPLHKCKK